MMVTEEVTLDAMEAFVITGKGDRMGLDDTGDAPHWIRVGFTG
jgi:hypothetical protein